MYSDNIPKCYGLPNSLWVNAVRNVNSTHYLDKESSWKIMCKNRQFVKKMIVNMYESIYIQYMYMVNLLKL